MLNEPTQTKLQEMRLSAMADAWREQQRNPDDGQRDAGAGAGVQPGMKRCFIDAGLHPLLGSTIGY